MTATITLDDDDQSTVQRMLTYLYTLDYDDDDASPAVARDQSPNKGSPVLEITPKPDVNDDDMISHRKNMINIRVYALAEKYNIPALKDLAKTKFETCVTAREIQTTRLTEIVDSIFDSTYETDPGLRDVIIRKIAITSTPEQMLEEGPLASAIRNHSSFGLGLLREVIRKHISEREKQKQDVTMKMTELRRATGRLYLSARLIDLPDIGDSQEDFDNLHHTMNAFLEKMDKFQETLKLED